MIAVRNLNRLPPACITMGTIVSLVSALIPVAYFAISSAISMVALNVSQASRVYFLPFLLLTASLSFHHLNHLPSWYGLNGLWGLFVTVYVVHITSALYVEQWVLPTEDGHHDNYYEDSYDSQQTRWNFKAAYKIWNNPRWLNTPNEAPGISKAWQRTTMTEFIRTRITNLFVCSAIHFLVASKIFPGPFRPISIDDFSSDRETYIRSLLLSTEGVTVRETLLRSVLAVQWISAAYVLLEGSHHVWALFFVVVVRIDEPDEWPPLFGSLLETCSIRRFWGKFWHRVVYRPYTSYASLLSRRVLGLEPHSIYDKLFVTFNIFLLSGTAHSLVSWQLGHRCGVWRDMAWFCANFVAGAVEMTFEKRIRAILKRRGYLGAYQTFLSGWLRKALGFLWVFAFFFWSVPKWEYPKIYCVTLDLLNDKKA